MDPFTGLLTAGRVTGIVNALQDPRLISPQAFVWSNRIPDVSAFDEEIMARFVGTLTVADLIADDAKAVIYSQGKLQYETTKVPNLKMGIGLNQVMLNALDRIQNGQGTPQDMGIFSDWQGRTAAAVKYGVNLRAEMLRVAMLTDGFNYDRLGVKLQNVTWGMPSDLKVTTATPWDNVAATPITDVNTVRRVARVRYGVELDRMTLSTSALQFAVKTTEFVNQARSFGFGLAGLPAPAIPLQSDEFLTRLFQNIMGTNFTIEIDDRRAWSQDTVGQITNAAIQPITQVILTSKANDGNSGAMDFANGIVSESLVSQNAPVNVIGGRIPRGYGPISYVTAADSSLNPPGLVWWGVKRGFPRKHQLQASAVLTVGTFSDTIAVGVPFPS